MITLGLRVENRTAANLYDVLEQTIIRLAQKLPKLAIVIDGHNSRLDDDIATAFESFGQGSFPSPVLAELDLVMRLKHRFDYSSIRIINMIGASMFDSIAWVEASLCFVGFWGAGLAKYRWICNKIGLIISSRINLTSRLDLHIYDSPEFQENPAPVLYIDPASVVDCPEAPVLFSPDGPGSPSYANFHVDCATLVPQIDRLLEMAAAQPVPKPLEQVPDPI